MTDKYVPRDPKGDLYCKGNFVIIGGMGPLERRCQIGEIWPVRLDVDEMEKNLAKKSSKLRQPHVDQKKTRKEPGEAE